MSDLHIPTERAVKSTAPSDLRICCWILVVLISLVILFSEVCMPLLSGQSDHRHIEWTIQSSFHVTQRVDKSIKWHLVHFISK